jgi:hypothetical protein
MSWLITPAQRTDSDALAYLVEVERADGQALESGVRDAVIAFVTGCKTDGIWTAIKASCILAGARTRAGALVPLVGAAPTSFNFVNGDYNRKTGLVGNGSTKYLNANRAGNADPQNDRHCSVFVSTTAGNFLLGAGNGNGRTTISQGGTRSSATTAYTFSSFANNNTFVGHSRSEGASYANRFNSTEEIATIASQSPTADNYFVFASSSGTSTVSISTARLAFYSIGESLNLALLDARVTTLIQAIDAAIPS